MPDDEQSINSGLAATETSWVSVVTTDKFNTQDAFGGIGHGHLFDVVDVIFRVLRRRLTGVVRVDRPGVVPCAIRSVDDDIDVVDQRRNHQRFSGHIVPCRRHLERSSPAGTTIRKL